MVGLDAPDRESLDWAAPYRHHAGRFEPHDRQFELAREALGSKVRRELVSVYDVTPERLGTFDLVFVGSILVHLRDPVGALMALRTVSRRDIKIAEEVDRRLDVFRKTGLARFQAMAPYMTWWIANRTCWGEMLEAAGFVHVRHGKTFVIPFGSRRGGVRHAVLDASCT